ncbi:MAG: formylglycine-generating enzyme family protein [Phycisphaerales bacterium]
MTSTFLCGCAIAVAAGTAGSALHAQAPQTPAESSPPSPPGMRWIPAGEFTMGTDDAQSQLNERPAHRVRVSGIWMDETDVTNAQFAAFIKATGYITTAEKPVDWEELKKQVPPGTPKPSDEDLKPGSLVFTPPGQRVDTRNMANWWTWTHGADWRHPQGPSSSIQGKDDYPVLQVSWDDAAAYAKWAGKRLPTEAEWEHAARGGAEKNTRFWWGDEFKPAVPGKGATFMANTYTGEFPVKDTAEDGYAGPSPVKAFPANGYGLYDMAGNVWNWCADFYADNAHVEATEQAKSPTSKTPGLTCDPSGPAKTFSAHNPQAFERVTKGGSFLCSASYCESYRPTARRGTPPDTGTGHIGFRCVMTSEMWEKAKPRAAEPARGPSNTGTEAAPKGGSK